jgi:ubiquinone/menaquinone biosynthesis C-methylase UbiE
MTIDKNRVCPVERANSLDNKVRRYLQNPKKILKPFVNEGMNVLDIGCGPGFFSIELAKLVGNSGKVFAVDLQEGMLQKIRDKIKGTELEERITLIKSEQVKFTVPEKVHFILAFYMVHEVPDKNKLFEALINVLDDNGNFLLVEPKLFHVSHKEFNATLQMAEMAGFKISNGPKLLFSFSAILKKSKHQ